MTEVIHGRAQARYRGPSPLAGYVERKRLDCRSAPARGRLVRILAPAGYGKTSLAARWARSDKRVVRWLDVERAHSDPVALCNALREALAGIVDIPWPSLRRDTSESPHVVVLRQALTAGEEERIEPFLLVLDDVHRVSSEESGQLIDTLVEHLPSSSTIMLVGRGYRDHAGSIGRFRLVPGVVDVTVHDLAFDASECRRMLELMGVDMPTLDLERLVELLEGWPAGLRLAGRVMLDRGATGSVMDLADDVVIVDYLRGEWTSQLRGRDVAFLREIACLERCTGEMCDRILQRSGSAAVLQRLHRDELVVFDLDRRDEWYRLHPLLSRWLSTELRAVDPRRWRDIHVNAARYWEENSEIDRAFGHARLAEDLTYCELLAASHGGAYFTLGMAATVESWLAAFPSHYVRTSPGLCTLSVLLGLHCGDDSRTLQWQRLLEEAISAQSEGERDSSLATSWSKVLHAVLDERPASELTPIGEDARAHLPGGTWTSFVCWVLGALYFLVGDRERADDALQQALFEAEIAGNPLLTAHCLGTWAIIDECSGSPALAAWKSRRASAALHECHGELLPTTAPVMAVNALVAAHDRRWEEATERLGAARHALQGLRSVAPWFNVVSRLALVQTSLLLDDRETSRALMSELEHHGRLEPSDGALMSRVQELRAKVDAMHHPAAGATALTDAERNVLHYLPTNLSLGEIGGRLFISRNTVKSHAAAIYRKLGANSRTEAVNLAEVAGLLDELSFTTQ